MVAHDHKKPDLVEWAKYNQRLLVAHDLVATGTTGTLLEDELGVGITKLQSGPSVAISSGISAHRMRRIVRRVTRAADS